MSELDFAIIDEFKIHLTTAFMAVKGWKPLSLDHIHILSIGLELDCNVGISLKEDFVSMHLKRLPALASVASSFSSNTKSMKMVY